MSFDPEKLQAILANIQASNQMVMKVYEYPPIKIGATATPKITFKKLVALSCNLFEKYNPNYRLGNLNVEKLTSNVVKAVDVSIPNKVIKISNGCCTLKDCPTQLYYECVLEVLRGLIEP